MDCKILFRHQARETKKNGIFTMRICRGLSRKALSRMNVS